MLVVKATFGEPQILCIIPCGSFRLSFLQGDASSIQSSKNDSQGCFFAIVRVRVYMGSYMFHYRFACRV